jgi:hypothetical protein
VFWFTATMICGTVAPVLITVGAGGPSDAHGFRQPGEQLAPELATTASSRNVAHHQRENPRQTLVHGN